MTDTESTFRQKLIAEAYLENSKLQLKELKENVIVLIGLIKTGQNAKAYLQMLVVETLLESKPSLSDVSMTQDVLTDIETRQSVEKETCSWIQEDDPDICYWKTGCGNSFYFTEGTPTDNNMKYCCYCGKLLKQED